MIVQKLYTRKQLFTLQVYPFGAKSLEVNLKEGTIPKGRLINNRRVWTQEEAGQIQAAVLAGKLVTARGTRPQAAEVLSD